MNISEIVARIQDRHGKMPSKFQVDIFDFIINGRGDAVVQAVAGSGKTQTLVWASDFIYDGLFIAFNRHIAVELKARIPGMECRTIHSIGVEAIRLLLRGRGVELKTEQYKYKDLARDLVKERFPDLTRWYNGRLILTGDGKSLAGTLASYADFARLTLTPAHDRTALEALGGYYGLDELVPDDYRLVDEMIRKGDDMARNRGIIDFTDMIYLPAKFAIPMPRTFGWILVDECQDLNAAQLKMVLKLRAAGGRMLFVGDSNQSIYGFAGATPDSVAQIIRRTGARELPLSICYRCPRSHIALAQRYVPHIEAAPGATEGILEHIGLGALFTTAAEGDLILCRKTAPLVGLCLELIAQRIPARVKGRAVGEELVKRLEDIAGQPNFTYQEFPAFADDYRRVRVEKLAQRDHTESKIERLTDEVDALHAAFQSFACNSVEQLSAELLALFTDDRASVWLSTVHRAKGLEGDRVFIIEPDCLPMTWKGQSADELKQEENLTYVAHTRAKKALYIVGAGGGTTKNGS